MKIKENSFLRGVLDGLPICIGYISVAFAFGIFSVESGLSFFEALLISMTNVTSAGQLAAVPIICCGGGFFELAVTQFVINLRYALMSVSLSQKLDKNVSTFDRLVISFVNTDEVFAVASGKGFSLKKSYLYGLILTPYLGWSFGTAVGAFAGNILPQIIITSLSLAIYAMFVAIVLPAAKKNKPTAICAACAVVLSCCFKYIPALGFIPDGFVIIICAAVASAFMAYVSPICMEEDQEYGEELE